MGGLVFGLACNDDRLESQRVVAATAVTSAEGPTVLASETAPDAPSALPPPVPGALAGARLLLDRADRQDDQRVRARMAAGILEELEEGRLPGRVMRALVAASERKLEAAQRAEVVWDAIASTPSMLDAWNRACDSGPFDDGGGIVARLAARGADARTRSATIFGLCRLGRGGLIGLADLSVDHDLVVLAHAIRAYLAHASPGSLAPEEERALRLLARGGRRPAPPFDERELPALDEPKRLPAAASEALGKRLREGIALLQRGATKAFFAQVVHPAEVGGLRLDAAAESFARSGKAKALRQALELAADRAPVDDGDGEASIRLPWRPQPDARERVRFQLHEGTWRLRL